MTSIVYMATNTVNGKRYIGATSKGLRVRRKQHEQAPNAKRITCRYFHAAIKKHGAGAFEWTVLVRCESFADALKAEVHLIAQMKPEYNLTLGGQGTAGRTVSKEARLAASLSRRGRPQTPEEKQRQIEAQTGRKYSESHRAAISAGKRGKAFSDEHKARLRVARARQVVTEQMREKYRQNSARRPRDAMGRMI
ncbi:MAG: GIY-YIG nuclease family protein [Salinibacterium sp.]|nr:MAG: GIY-YIG nuclease family protein [Salinibacterium sp.]